MEYKNNPSVRKKKNLNFNNRYLYNPVKALCHSETKTLFKRRAPTIKLTYFKPYGFIKVVIKEAIKVYKYGLYLFLFKYSPMENIKIKTSPIENPPWRFAHTIFNAGKHQRIL